MVTDSLCVETPALFVAVTKIVYIPEGVFSGIVAVTEALSSLPVSPPSEPYCVGVISTSLSTSPGSEVSMVIVSKTGPSGVSDNKRPESSSDTSMSKSITPLYTLIWLSPTVTLTEEPLN